MIGCMVLECQLEMWIKSRQHFDCTAPVFFRVKIADDEEDQTSTVKTLAGFYSHFKLVYIREPCILRTCFSQLSSPHFICRALM